MRRSRAPQATSLLLALLCIHTASIRFTVLADERLDGSTTSPRGRVVLDGGASYGHVLSLTPPRVNGPMRTPTGGGWRHDYDIVLTARDSARVIHDGTGDRHEFVPSETPVADPKVDFIDARLVESPRYRSMHSTSGTLEVEGRDHVWHRDDATRVTFAGSVPVRVETAAGDVRTLHYANGLLLSVVDANGPTLRFEHEEGRLRGIALDERVRWRLTLDSLGKLQVGRDAIGGECSPSEGAIAPENGVGSPVPAKPTRCDTRSSRPDEDFLQAPGIPGAVRIDARPASCRSYFSDFAGTARGVAIESGLDGLTHYAGHVPTVRSFPIVDFVGEELRVVRSRDLASPSYLGPRDALLARLLADGEEIVGQLLEPLAREGRLSVTELGRTTTLVHSGKERVVLELVVRHGLASPDQIRQIAQARRELLARHDLLLRVIEIP